MNAITYLLKTSGTSAQQYYDTVATFSDEVLAKLHEDATQIIARFSMFVTADKKDGPETVESLYYLDFLMMGVYWRQYINNAVLLPPFVARMLSVFSSLRERSTITKVLFDPLRGVLGTHFLLKETNKEIAFSTQNLAKLQVWLNSAGEFKQEAERLKEWILFLQTIEQAEAEKIIRQSTEVAAWFEVRSTQELSQYVSNVDRFVQEESDLRKWKENHIFCRRGKVEYFLNMVGAEIMNRAFRPGFVRSRVKRVLVPTCLRSHYKRCKAVKSAVGYSCRQCSATCKVNSLVRLGNKNNFSVSVIPHSTSAFTSDSAENAETGIIGIACTLNLISGGLKAKARGLQAQCVLLNYCGCKKHWHKDGITTDFDVDRLIALLPDSEV